jgi:hypothetical protein
VPATLSAADRPRIDIPQAFPIRDGESRESWTERLTRAAAKNGVYRQCSIGWHEDCSQRREPGPDCPCNCTCHVTGAAAAPEVPAATHGTPEAPGPSGEQYVRQAQAAALRGWVHTVRAELDQAQQMTSTDEDEFHKGIRSALDHASRRADDIEAGTHTVDSDHQEIPR